MLCLGAAAGWWFGIEVPKRAEVALLAKTQAEHESLLKEAKLKKPAVATDVNTPKAGDTRVVDLGGGVRMTMCFIPPGSFTMGSPAGEAGRNDDEKQVPVQISKGYWLAQTECTQVQWRVVMGTEPSHYKGDDLPVERVSWHDVQAFMTKLNGTNLLPGGWVWSLPSEAQWEYACRAGTTGPYAGELDRMAWHEGNSGGKTNAVGAKAANEWGLHDMHGNVYEWCSDWYGDKLPGGADPTGAVAGSKRVLRGGHARVPIQASRSANRVANVAHLTYGVLGFRVAAVPEWVSKPELASEPPSVSELVKKLGGTYDSKSAGDKITFVRTNLTTPDLMQIGTAQRLKNFSWNGGKGLTDEGMAAFAGMKNLESLMLWAVGSITDAGLKHLGGCDKLASLNIGANGGGITGTGFESLSQCESLRELTFNFLVNIEGQNLRFLSQLKSLEVLGLSACRGITDADLEWVRQMPKLRKLDLGSTGVSDAGLLKLAGMSSLKELNVTPPLVTPAGVAALTKASPELVVRFSAKLKKPAVATDINTAKAGDTRVVDLGGGVRMTICFIPPGSFTMGSPAGEAGRDDDEKQVRVQISKGYWLAQTECTQVQWRVVMGTEPSHFKGDDLPVESVNWDEAQQFMAKLNARNPLPAGWVWSLPSEAQWEYACRAGTTGPYAGELDRMAWHEGNSGGETIVVGAKAANEWGLQDMHGNVWEWCSDWYGDKLPGGTDPAGASSGSRRVNRGGSCFLSGRDCRSASRGGFVPDYISHYFGFRAAAIRTENPGQAGVTPKNEAADKAQQMAAQVKRERLLKEAEANKLATINEVNPAKAGDTRKVDLGGGVRMTLCFIPPDNFIMGSPASEPDRSTDEDQVPVQISKGYWLAQTECTQAQWRAVMGTNPSWFRGDDLPVESVSWDDAQAFMTKLNSRGALQAGWKWSLPTEAQWEYACRAGTTTAYAGNLLQMAWTSDYFARETHPVGSKTANPWGLRDMHGNVSEWCLDWYGDKLPGGTDPAGASPGSRRVHRGGSFFLSGRASRSASRGGFVPDYLSHYFGFRAAAVPLEVATPEETARTDNEQADAEEKQKQMAAALVAALSSAEKSAPFSNSLGMKFAPVKITGGTGGPTDGKSVLFSIWHTRVKDYAAYAKAMNITPEPPNFAQTENHPVVNVSWEDAKAFCAWLTASDHAAGKLPAGWQYRLPSDHEWSCAIGIGDKEDASASPQGKNMKILGYSWGSAWPPPQNQGNYVSSLKVDDFEYTSPVGSFPSDHNGLCDMGGNVWQWCEDWYDTSHNFRVLRGGCWSDRNRGFLLSSFRDHGRPGSRDDCYGFRVVVVVSGG